MSGNRIIPVVLVLGLLLAFAVYCFMQREPATIPVANTATKPDTNTKTDNEGINDITKPKVATKPAPAESELVDLGLTTEQLFEELFKALDAGDQYAASQLLKQLQNSKEPIVIPTAKKHFVTTALEPETDQFVSGSIQYYMLILFADGDPEYALSNVRNDWGKGGLCSEISTGWEEFQSQKVDRIASMFLRYSKSSDPLYISFSLSPAYTSVDALAKLIVGSLQNGKNRHSSVLKWLRNSYSKARETEELPDPWLSYLIFRMAHYWDTYNDDQRAEIILFLTWIVESDDFSERLIAQAEVLLQSDPHSFWEMMDILATTKSTKAVGKALAGLLATRALTTEEHRQFVEAFYKRFASDVTSFQTIMTILLSYPEDKVPLEHIQSFALDSVQNAIAVTEEAMVLQYTSLLLAVGNAWEFNHRVGHLLALNDDLDIIDLFTLLERIAALQDGKDVWVILELFWYTDRSISQKISDVTKAADLFPDGFEDFFRSVINGLNDGLEELRPSDAKSVVALLDIATEKTRPFKKLITTRTPKSIVDTFAITDSIIRLYFILGALDFPSISQSLKNTINSLIMTYRSDNTNTQEKVTEYSIVLVNKYELTIGNKGD